MTEPYPYPEKADLETKFKELQNKAGFQDELTKLINRYSQENNSGTPDFIMAQYIQNSLNAFNLAVNEREKWYGRTQDRFGMPERGPLQAEINSEDNGWTKHD